MYDVLLWLCGLATNSNRLPFCWSVFIFIYFFLFLFHLFALFRMKWKLYYVCAIRNIYTHNISSSFMIRDWFNFRLTLLNRDIMLNYYFVRTQVDFCVEHQNRIKYLADDFVAMPHIYIYIYMYLYINPI